jgi:hypothetical protein
MTFHLYWQRSLFEPNTWYLFFGAMVVIADYNGEVL